MRDKYDEPVPFVSEAEYPTSHIMEYASAIRGVAGGLNGLGAALQRLGLPAGEELFLAIEDIQRMSDLIRNEALRGSSEALKASQEATFNVVQAALAGIDIGARSKDLNAD